MSKIAILSDSVANQIAAGEVVERPASIVKELVENAIDAGAGKIVVEVEDGGRTEIRVTDDGEGMSPEDAVLCFRRHATSKLGGAADLAAIATLGFRGEALPAIASVSRVLLETQARGAASGTAVEIEGGEQVALREEAFPPGTRITVRDVFFNTPARRKFLKSSAYELSQVTAHCTHYALAFPGLHLVLKSRGFEVLAVAPAGSPRERVFQIFGGDLLEDLVEYSPGPSASGMRVHLFTSRPHVQKYNRNSMHFFVNGRAVRDRTLMHAYSDAYRNILPPGVFPVTILYLETPPGEVDVNVHPAKTEVRFRQSGAVHDAVRDAVGAALRADKTIIPMRADARTAAARLPGPPDRFPDSGRAPFAGAAAAALAYPAAAQMLDWREAEAVVGRGLEADVPPRDFELIRQELRPLGQLRDSFIVAADNNGLVLIDQHVAHERVLFEAHLVQQEAGAVEVQRLLTPIVIELTPRQEVLFEAIAAELAASGFEVEPFGPRTVAVMAAPAILKADQVEKLLGELLDGAERERQEITFDSFARKIAATVACHAAIKVNNPLDGVKMRWLVSELMKTDCPTVCPHGRPIIVRYDLREIQKAFKRV